MKIVCFAVLLGAVSCFVEVNSFTTPIPVGQESSAQVPPTPAPTLANIADSTNSTVRVFRLQGLTLMLGVKAKSGRPGVENSQKWTPKSAILLIRSDELDAFTDLGLQEWVDSVGLTLLPSLEKSKQTVLSDLYDNFTKATPAVTRNPPANLSVAYCEVFLQNISRRNEERIKTTDCSCDCGTGEEEEDNAEDENATPQHHNPTGTPQHHNPTGTPQHHNPTGTPQHHNPTGTPQHHNPTGTPQHHNPTGTPQHHNPTAIPQHHNSTMVPQHHKGGAKSSQTCCCGKGQKSYKMFDEMDEYYEEGKGHYSRGSRKGKKRYSQQNANNGTSQSPRVNWEQMTDDVTLVEWGKVKRCEKLLEKANKQRKQQNETSSEDGASKNEDEDDDEEPEDKKKKDPDSKKKPKDKKEKDKGKGRRREGDIEIKVSMDDDDDNEGGKKDKKKRKESSSRKKDDDDDGENKKKEHRKKEEDRSSSSGGDHGSRNRPSPKPQSPTRQHHDSRRPRQVPEFPEDDDDEPSINQRKRPNKLPSPQSIEEEDEM